MNGSATRSNPSSTSRAKASGASGDRVSRAANSGARPEIWAVLNVTPDSFSDGGRFASSDAAIAEGLRLAALGADVVDVGGESTRPPGKDYGGGAAHVGTEEELARVLPVVRGLAARGVRVSIDTSKGAVARACVEVGAQIINDVQGGRDPELLAVAAGHPVELVLMHNRGRGETSGTNVVYADVVATVIEELRGDLRRARAAGVSAAQIWLDPGYGFAKDAAQSLALLARSAELFAAFPEHRFLLGASRKSFLARATPDRDGSLAVPADRLAPSLASALWGMECGADALRVHDVRETRRALELVAQLRAISGEASQGMAIAMSQPIPSGKDRD